MTLDLSFLGLGVIDLTALSFLPHFQSDNFYAQLMVYVLVFIGGLLAFEGIRQLGTRGEMRKEARNRRMRMIEEGKSSEEILALLKPEPKERGLARLPLLGGVPKALRQAGMTMSPVTFLGACGVGTFAFAFVASQLVGALIGVPVALVLFGVLPIIIVHARAKERMDAFVKQLPEALELMSRGLRVGHPLNTTIRSVATDMADPIASEFGIVADQVAYGDDLTDAFNELAERIDLEDVRYLAVSVGIQHGAGGDLARVLTTLARVIRNRLSMRRRIKAISAEGRVSAYVLSIIPVVIFAFTSITAPDYYGDVMDHPSFTPLAIIVVCLVIANAVTLTRLVNFRI